MQVSKLFPILTLILALCAFDTANAQTTVTIGTGSSSSSTRGPFQRSDTASSTVFSRWVQIFTADELAAAGVPSGSSIESLHWELASSNVIIGSGDATLRIHVKNSTATEAVEDTWENHVAGSSLVVDNSYNVNNNFPGANGWMPFDFTSPFTYDGGALEVAVDWDCSQVTTPAFSGDGALKWRWASTAPDFLVVKKTSSSAPSTNITDLKDERANIQIVFSAGSSCPNPTGLGASNITENSADINWTASTGAMSYNWIVVPTGAGSGATPVASGNISSPSDVVTGLAEFTGYDLYVQADCGMTNGTSDFAGPYEFFTSPVSLGTITIGAGTSSSSTRGPFQRSDTASSTIFSRFVHIYTESELAAAGLENGSTITALHWELASSNVIIGDGNATMKVYIKNSSATEATADTWDNLVSGSDLVVDNAYNTDNNFPGANGWMPFAFSSPYVYTGGALEIAVDWDCSQVSTPAFSGDGSLKWRWESTDPEFLVVKRTSSSSPSTDISDLKNERANIQFVFAGNADCLSPTDLDASNISSTSAEFSWTSPTQSMASNWVVVLEGAGSNGTVVDMGSSSTSSASSSNLEPGVAYDLYVESDCGGSGVSAFAGPFTFTTSPSSIDDIEILDFLALSPNPTSDIVTLDMELSQNAPVAISIFTSTGELVESIQRGDMTQLRLPIDLSAQGSGLYFVRISVGQKQTMKKVLLIK